ncbi:TPA: Dabb family protein [Vibrio parahaemolyticus]|uniref:Dabb family protein n=1 Tax=Vibrio parahaemolyticus TaxID=670 RepID=UPI00111F1F37|nr:Dabb family protein [Vibrio parahaemolyticus]TOG36843.1 stress protein [Vibrio parahaemolyticus]HCH5588626.1 Dabb family protein [Vibrio parahaemolyticus]HCM1552967.1 Dabb family protein [Vibrio parahaemolyticus]
MIRHILLLRFNQSAELPEINRLKDVFTSLPNKIEGVLSVEWGENDSPEGKNQGYTHSVLMTFVDDKGRENYLYHPEHDALKKVFRPLLDDIVVFDFTV